MMNLINVHLEILDEVKKIKKNNMESKVIEEVISKLVVIIEPYFNKLNVKRNSFNACRIAEMICAKIYPEASGSKTIIRATKSGEISKKFTRDPEAEYDLYRAVGMLAVSITYSSKDLEIIEGAKILDNYIEEQGYYPDVVWEY